METLPHTVTFYDHIRPILAVHCYKCHDSATHKGGLALDNSTNAWQGGKSGRPAIAPGQSGQSELVRRLTSIDPDDRMPPEGPGLAAEEIALIKQWIDQGAQWPHEDRYWAFQRPLKPSPPVVNPGDSSAPHHPIDQFIADKLNSAGLSPAPPADARTLLRRAHADLIGVPPSPEEAERFFNDHSPDAFARLIDRLLADPRYGERWARHWLDLARYGESDGYEDDKIRPHAWRYRDYVRDSFNAGKRYDRFAQEQIAGDELWPDEPEAWIATGFARLGAWDGMSKEPAQQRQDFLNDVTDAVGSVFLGITLGCARCHDHKYDRISQRDYYRMQAFFAGVKRETRDFSDKLKDPEFVTGAYEQTARDLKKLREEKETMTQTARFQIEWERRCELDENGQLKIADAELAKKAEALHPKKWAEVNARVKSVENQQRFYAPKIDAVFGADSNVKTRILKGGELNRPGEEVEPGFIAAFQPGVEAPDQPNLKPATRAQLARWITAPENPLFARVIVNRLWQHHFGAGLVLTASDFGRNGRRPTHPELLDWLACEFVEREFSLKKMHKLIMTSAAYRRAASPDPIAMAKDPENKLLWRMNRRRLEGEAIRDSILAVSGALASKMGGPGVYAKLPKGVSVELPNNDKELSWYEGSDEDNRRRSLYLFQRRSLTFPLLEVFDGPPMNQTCPVRAQTTVAPQALALFNGEFCRESARLFAHRLRNEASHEPRRQIELAFQIAFARQPSEAEFQASLEFLARQQALRQADGEQAASLALTDFCHSLLNANEMIYID